MTTSSAQAASRATVDPTPSESAMRDPAPRSPLRVLGFGALAWLPFFGMWALMNAVYFGVPIRPALIAAASAMGSAAILGFGVFWISGRLTLPDQRVGLGFYLAHFALASLYSALWIGWGAVLAAIREGVPLQTALADSPMIGWRFVTGVWLYGMVAGASYAVRMRRRVQLEREAALRAQAAASRARLAQVRSQLRPHFLFNALHSVSSLIAIDVDEAQSALERLGDMLRYALDDDAELVPLRREWDFVHDYLAIETLRLEGGLQVDARCERAARELVVPPFSLQCLVENAVRHGVASTLAEPAVGPGVLRIEARIDLASDELVLRVADDGPGADPEAVRSSTGRGLRLLREGLAARWGVAARLEIETAPGAGLVSTVRLPAKPLREVGCEGS